MDKIEKDKKIAENDKIFEIYQILWENGPTFLKVNKEKCTQILC